MYYKFKDMLIYSQEFLALDSVDCPEERSWKRIFYASPLPLSAKSQIHFSMDSLSFKEGLEDLRLPLEPSVLDCDSPWLKQQIQLGNVTLINSKAPAFLDNLESQFPKKWRIHVIALGDVGATLTMGLRLMGGEDIDYIGIYDFDSNKVNRVLLECNQIYTSFTNHSFPEVKAILQEDLFDCDMFVFCASKFIPPIDVIDKDVRMLQFEANSAIISQYAKLAREQHFKGFFAVVSDPVDLLCKVVYLESNKNELGQLDFLGLPPERIKGYGLGVMNARAKYYADLLYPDLDYANEGRAFGPHGKGLVIANSLSHYDADISQVLTEKTKDANLEVRKTGYKPYIAPALSSGALSILATIRGDWHYSTVYFGGVFLGVKNKIGLTGLQWEQYNFNTDLYTRLQSTYDYLGDII